MEGLGASGLEGLGFWVCGSGLWGFGALGYL